MPEHLQENERLTPEWRKSIMKHMFHGLERPHIKGSGWEMIFDKQRTGEYSFIVGNAILYIDEDGNFGESRILHNGHVSINKDKNGMMEKLEEVLEKYAKQHDIPDPGGPEKESYDMTVDVKDTGHKDPGSTSNGIIRKIRRKLHF